MLILFPKLCTLEHFMNRVPIGCAFIIIRHAGKPILKWELDIERLWWVFFYIHSFYVSYVTFLLSNVRFLCDTQTVILSPSSCPVLMVKIKVYLSLEIQQDKCRNALLKFEGGIERFWVSKNNIFFHHFSLRTYW